MPSPWPISNECARTSLSAVHVTRIYTYNANIEFAVNQSIKCLSEWSNYTLQIYILYSHPVLPCLHTVKRKKDVKSSE